MYTHTYVYTYVACRRIAPLLRPTGSTLVSSHCDPKTLNMFSMMIIIMIIMFMIIICIITSITISNTTTTNNNNNNIVLFAVSI